jgi:hypothetical protein
LPVAACSPRRGEPERHQQSIVYRGVHRVLPWMRRSIPKLIESFRLYAPKRGARSPRGLPNGTAAWVGALPVI